MENNSVIEQVNTNKKKTLSKKQKRKLVFLLFSMSFTILLLVGGTYAWFIGLGKSEIEAFDLEVTSANQMKLSLTADGTDWSNSVTISEDTVTSAGYTGNTNHGVGEEGLLPVSTVGHINTTNSRLDFFSKTSISSSAGGYRLLADPVPNSIALGEQDGYFVFDLFIQNGTDVDYIEGYNYDDDEDIYFIKGNDNSVVAAPAGAETDDYGIANSVRVALMQIGRVKSVGYTPATAQQITCADNSTLHITGLCNKGVGDTDTGLGKTWNIWEPNDDKHHEVLVDRFNLICKKRNNDLSYTTTSCTELEEDTILTTYAVNKTINTEMDSVDIYDGLNDYIPTEDHGLTAMNYLTDTEINTTDNSTRQAIFRLAANSITKVRIYIYLEGQDVDNYDMIYKGEKIKVKFGFTRDRYELEDK